MIGGYKINLYFEDLNKKEKISQFQNKMENFVKIRNSFFNINKFGHHSFEFHFESCKNLSELLSFLNLKLEEESFDQFSINQFSMDDIYLNIMKKN